MKKIGMLNSISECFEIYYDEKVATNPYRVYERYWDHGRKRKQIVRYANLASCTWYINNYVMDHDEEHR